MIIRHITIRDFGAVSCYDTPLTPELNIIDSRYSTEICAAIAFLLCSKTQPPIPTAWLRPTTRLCARVLAQADEYTVTASFCNSHFTLAVRNHSGADVTDAYRRMLSHCPEQDAAERFDGNDKNLPLHLCWYRNRADAPENISGRAQSLADTKTFRSHLLGYIKNFRPEPINCRKDYQAVMTPEGRFEVFHPGIPGRVFLSTTEEKLFRYICFLNIAEFWAEVEKIRDLHHEKKPLLIQNFLEYLDESTDIRTLIARTKKLQRQVLVLTPPLEFPTAFIEE